MPTTPEEVVPHSLSMGPIRPRVDAYLLKWITNEPFRRDWFFEQRDGNCRLMGSFAMCLSETASTWERAILPRLAGTRVQEISLALGISEPYAAHVRKGKHIPHPRHWLTLASLVGVSSDE